VGELRIEAVFYSVLPSPYQRDLFYALNQLSQVSLTVFYLERAYWDSPWPQAPLRSYESVLPGFDLRWGNARFHINWHPQSRPEADVIIFNGYTNAIAQSVLRCQSDRVPCLFWGEQQFERARGVQGQLTAGLRAPLQNCRAIAAIGSGAARDYQQRFPDKPIFNIPYYCNLETFQAHIPQRPRYPPTILFCGQMIPRKGVDLLLQSFERVLGMGLEAKLLLVGREGKLPQMLMIISERTRQHIEYAGFQASGDLPRFFRRADLFVLPSRYDGWGVVVNQAIGAGLPVVCSDAVGAARDLIEPNGNGSIVPAGDVDALAEGLAHYLQAPGLIQQASIYSWQKAQAWTPDVGAQQWLDALAGVTRLGRGA